MDSNNGKLKYIKHQIRLPRSGAAKWYVKAVHDRTVEFDDFVTLISEHSSPYSRGVINGVLKDMFDCLRSLVLDGKSVRLGDIGLVSVGIKSRGAASPEECDDRLVEGVRLNVRNTKSWSNAELRKRCSLSELTEYSADDLSAETD